MIRNQHISNAQQSGFTLIELMIVIAILGILAAIAIPAYQDYTVRAKVSEATQAVAPFTTAVGVYYWTNQIFPVNRTQSGQSNVNTKYITGVTITTTGLISVDIDETTTGVSSMTSDTMYLIYTPTEVAGAIDWSCRSNNAVDGTGDNINLSRFVPSNCR